MTYYFALALLIFAVFILLYKNKKTCSNTYIFLSVLVSEMWGIYFLKSLNLISQTNLLLLLPLISISFAYFIHAGVFHNILGFKYYDPKGFRNLISYLGCAESKFLIIFWLIISTLLIAIQLNYLKLFFYNTFHISENSSIAIVIITIATYASLGRINSILRGNILQILLFIIFIPVAISIWTNNYTPFTSSLNSFFEPEFNTLVKHSFSEFLALSLFFLTPFFIFTPTHFSRIELLKNTEDASMFYRYIGTFKLLLTFIALIIAGAIVYKYGKNSNTSIIDMVNDLPEKIKMIISFSILLIIMGFIDSHVYASASLITEEFFKKDSKIFSGLSIVFILICSSLSSLTLHYSITDFIQIIALWACAMGIPIFTCLIKMKSSKIAFWINSITTCILWLYLQTNAQELQLITPVILITTSMIIYYGITFLQHGGLTFITSCGKETLFATEKLKLGTLKFFNSKLYDVKKSFFNIIHMAETYKHEHKTFGYLCLIHYTIPYLLWNYTPQHETLIFKLRILSSIICFTVILHEMLPQKFNKHYHFLWLIAVTFCLPFNATLTFLMHNASVEWILNMTISTMIAILILDWLSFIITHFIGILAGILTYVFLFPNDQQVWQNYTSLYLITYILGFVFFIVMVFAKSQQQYIQEKIANMKVLGGAILHEINTPINHLHIKATFIKHFVLSKFPKAKNKDDKEVLEMVQTLDNDILRMQRTTELLLTALRNAYQPELQNLSQKHSLKKCVTSALESFHLKPEESKKINVQIKPDITFHGDFHLMENVILNLLSNAMKYAGKNAQISIYTRGKTLYFHDDGKGISSDILPFIFKQFYTANSRKGTGIGLAFCKIIIEGIGGNIKCKSKEGKYTKFIIKFP